MFCEKCGAQLQDNAKFCVKCGAPIPAQNSESPQSIIEKNFDVPIGFEKQETEEKKGGKKALIIVLVLLLVVLAAGGGIGVYQLLFADGAKYTKLIAEAAESIEQEDYEAAIGYYLNAIKLKDDDADTYIALADAYQQMEDKSKAVSTLEGGLEKTNSKAIQKELDRLNFENQNVETNADITTDATQSEENTISTASAEASDNEKQPYTRVRQNVNIGVRQVDASNFPEIVLYASVTDNGGNVVDGMDLSDFTISEIVDGTTIDAEVKDVYRVVNGDNVNVNLVMDASGSMSSSAKIDQAKNAAKALVNSMALTKGDKVEIISFDDYVYLEQEFTNHEPSLSNAIDGIALGSSTALYDALYAGLYQTYYEKGAKCVIGFTDGAENASSYSYQDVVDMSQNTGIPVFIIGIGDDYDAYALQNLANECSGQYYSADVNDLESILEDIYINIYQEQQDYYVLKYTTQNTQNVDKFREVEVKTSETSEYTGYYKKSYIPEADITGAFSGSYMNKDYMIADSGQRTVTEADLAGMSLAELRIARNEIFARHGRQFKDNMLNQWFYSKVWYLNIGMKYAPDTFDALSPSPLSKLEIDNANFIKNYEQMIMESQDIYPNASNIKLSDYDLALSKPVLKTALSQMLGYPSTAVLEENKRLVQEAINKEDVRY